MSTLSSEVFDLFLTNIDDYQITAIYTTSGSLILSQFLEPWLLNSIVEFDICDQDLSYTVAGSVIEGSFDETLTSKNKFMLATMMVKYYLAKNIQNLLSMKNILQDRDLKRHSAANNLKAKQDYYIMKCEEINQRLIDYEYSNISWESWRNQIFYS